MKINQVIAIEGDRKKVVSAAAPAIAQRLQKPELFSGMSRTYQPLSDDDPEKFPAEVKHVNYGALDSLREFRDVLSPWFDSTMSKDRSNCDAKADVTVEGVAILSDVPVTSLLFLEKQLAVILRAIQVTPELDTAQRWILDENAGEYRTEPTRTFRTKKEERGEIVVEATPQHPAQWHNFTRDVTVGTYSTELRSKAIARPEKTAMIQRVTGLIEAVKVAREEANGTEATEVSSAPLWSYIFGSNV